MQEETRVSWSLLILLGLGALQHLGQVNSQQDFTQAQVPTFRVGVFYPARSNNAADSERVTCRAITDRIDRNTARFNNELVTNTNSRITFSTADSRVMSSKMQSRLDDLAASYAQQYQNRRLTILKAWSPFPDPQLSGDDMSLHYEGRTVRVRLFTSQDYDNLLELAVEASFNWVYYASSNYVRLSVLPSNCERNVDCVFLLDRSGSVGITNHNIALDFISSVISFFTIGSNSSRVGMAAYSSSSAIQFDLDDHATSQALVNGVSRVVFTGGSTNTPSALDRARLLLNPTNNRGARLNSFGIPKIAILITDGRSNRGNLNSATSAIRQSDIQVYAVGIGNIDVNELRSIASDPDDQHVFILRSYLDAAGFVDFLSVVTCDAPAIVDPGDNTTTGVPDGGIKYFQTECPAFSDKILVEVIDINGTSFLFCSALQQNPGPLTPDTVRNETTGITRRTGLIRFPDQRKVVYVGVQGQGSSDSFTLIVWDQLFVPSDVFINVVEGTLSGVTIYEVSRNLTAAAQGNSYRYSFIEGDGDGIFSVDPNNGRVFIPNSGSPGVNFDLRRTHNLTVQAINNNQDCQRARIRINIRVISNRINFVALPTQGVPESATRNTFVVNVVATGGAGSIQYSIVGGNVGGAFAINGNTGRVRVNGSLNFEGTNSYTLRVRAVSTGTTVNGEMNLAINVLDINEPHVFTRSCASNQSTRCTYNINENRPSSTTIDTIAATDPDSSSSPNGTLRYSLSPVGAPFSVNTQGIIRTSQMLDRESQDSYSLVLRVSDNCPGTCSITIETGILVTVNDLNDNPPVFTLGPNRVQLSEDAPNNFVVAQYLATDADSGANARIQYSISPSNFPFSLNSGNGILTLTGNIDYESVQSYMITVTASDGTFTASVGTTIEIININDNRPVITNLPRQLDVEENSAPNTPVLQVMATDTDLEIHGEVRYFITGGNLGNSFSINTMSGAISVGNNIDRESITTFNLQIRAEDLGTPQRKRTQGILTITVTDVNDNRPLFRPASYSVQLREDLPVSSDVVQVFASDADQENNPNSMIAFTIVGGNTQNKFSIDSSSGEIVTSALLDFETTPAYTLTVVATDQGSPTMSSSATVSINIINVNESPPTLTGDQAVEVSELAPVNSIVARFQALDPDQMTVTFSITSGNTEGRFQIGISSGQISLANNLDYEITTMYTLGISASDGTNNANAVLSVTVQDENEFPPVFTGANQFSFLEEEPAGTMVGTVRATDGDRDDTISYSFVNQDQAASNFILNPTTGAITTADIIDREQQVQIFVPPSSSVTIEVSALDNGSPPKRSVRSYIIELEDINDNSPLFTSSEYSNMLLENLPSGQIVFETQATDPDLAQNGDVRYSFTLANGDSNLFEIDVMTGTITTTQGLDCEAQSVYTFSITATDMGTPDQRSSTVTGNLMVVDVNDNSPRFASIQPLNILESVNPDSNLITLNATDADKGLNGEIVYSVENDVGTDDFLESSFIQTFFEINQDTGVLRNSNEFDFESASQINVTVVASDRGIPQRQTSIVVTFNIMNIDETDPFIPSRSCDATISEGAPVGSEVSQCVAIDLDSIAAPGQDRIIFDFVSPNEFFEIDPSTGQIRVATPLDRERGSAVALNVRATDLAGRTGIRQTVIRLNDINDNAPTFERAFSFRFSDSDIQQYTRDILMVSAADPDFIENATVTYQLGNTFQLSNNIQTQVEVVALDMGTPQMSSRINVSVTFESPCSLQSYSIDSSSGLISADLLCEIEVTPPTVDIVLGGVSILMCRIVRNSPTSFQWFQNDSAITSPQVISQNRAAVSFVTTNIMFRDAGEYTCRATSPAGSLLSQSSTAIIQVSPTITTPPQDRSAAIGSSVTFSCSAIGLPPPDVQWFVGTRQIANGNNFTIAAVNASSMGTYTCAASNSASSVSSSARLTVFDSFNALQLPVRSINNPAADGTCHYFDPKIIETAIDQGASENIKTMVTAVQGNNLCEISPCSPSPCRNGGACSIDKEVARGYQCLCRQGYGGDNCTVDIDECPQDPCGGNGVCVNLFGSFTCNCNEGKSGRRCQFNDECSIPDQCAPGEKCIETSSVSDNFICMTPNTTSSIVVGGASVDVGQMSDLAQAFIERSLAMNNAGQQIRRKRQASTPSLITICEPRFVEDDAVNSILFWICPSGEDQPSVEAQQGLCTYLFELETVSTCKLPFGNEMSPPTVPPLPSVDITVTLVLVDGSNVPIDAVESLKTLEEETVLAALANTGLQVGEVTPEEPEPRPRSNSNSSSIIGGVVGTLLILALLGLLTVVIVLVVMRKRDSHKMKQEKKKKMALQMVVMEEGSTTGPITTTENIGYDAVPPKRPPKAEVVTSPVESPVEDDVYQNVAVGIPGSGSIDKLIDSEGNDYDTLPPKKELR